MCFEKLFYVQMIDNAHKNCYNEYTIEERSLFLWLQLMLQFVWTKN